jgi:hypothetical protein
VLKTKKPELPKICAIETFKERQKLKKMRQKPEKCFKIAKKCASP